MVSLRTNRKLVSVNRKVKRNILRTACRETLLFPELIRSISPKFLLILKEKRSKRSHRNSVEPEVRYRVHYQSYTRFFLDSKVLVQSGCVLGLSRDPYREDQEPYEDRSLNDFITQVDCNRK